MLYKNIAVISIFLSCVLSFHHIAYPQDQLIYEKNVEGVLSSDISLVLKRVYTIDEDDPCSKCIEPCGEKWVESCKGKHLFPCEPKTVLAVSVLSIGKGVHARKWIADKLVLELKDGTKIDPCDKDEYYVARKRTCERQCCRWFQGNRRALCGKFRKSG